MSFTMLAVAHTTPVRFPRRVTEKATMTAEEAEAKVLGKALAALRKRAGLTQAEAADAFGEEGISPQAWQRYEAGDRPSAFRLDQLSKLTGAVGASPDELMAERARILGKDVPTASVTPIRGLVGVYGFAYGQADRINLVEGAEIRHVPMHPAQAGYKRVGVAEVPGEAMFPRFKPRELAYFVFDLTPGRGEDVIVELKDGTAMVREYAGQREGQLHLREYFPEERTVMVAMHEVKALHGVVGR